MKYTLFQLVIFLLVYSNANSQILDFSNKKPKVIPIAYDSSYYKIPEYASEEKYEGLKDQRLVDGKGDIWIITGCTSNYSERSSGLKLMNLRNQKKITIEYFHFKDYYLEAGFEEFKNELIGLKVYPYIARNMTFIGYNDVEIVVKPNLQYEITDVKYAKFESDTYAPILELNNNGYYKLQSVLDKSLELKGNAKNNQIEFTLKNEVFKRKVISGKGKSHYDSSGDGIFGRKIVKRNWKELFVGGNQSKGKGQIAVMICVDRAGDVRYAEILFDETTETDSNMLKQAIKAAKGYKYQEALNTPPEQCGKLIFNLDINAFRGID